MRRTATHLSLIAATLLGSACASTTRTTLVFHHDDQPLVGAHVRAIALAKNDVPLPLTSETIAELLVAGEIIAQGWTDRSGAVEMTLLTDREHALEVSQPPLTESTIPAIWRWRYTPESHTYSPVQVYGQPPEDTPEITLSIR